MVSKLPENKTNYRQEAKNIRAKARETQDVEIKTQLLLIASLYDKLADHLNFALQPRASDDGGPQDPPE
jgi:hypothetical protein